MLFKKYFTNPCDGDCLVKATCHLRTTYTWTRSKQCPPYAKWRNRVKKKTLFIEWISTLFWLTLVVSVSVWILHAFGWGVYEQFKYIKGLF